MKVVLASNNMHKKIEMDSILKPYGMEIVTLRECEINMDVEETGSTFEENSLQKAEYVRGLTGMPVIADDSGLCVDYLHGEPGIFSARFGGEDARTDSDRYLLLLKKLKDVPQQERTARFVTVITLLFPNGKKLTARGECAGRIADTPKGCHGFGYDPVFIPDGYDKTMGELGEEVKNSISHRANALRVLNDLLKSELLDG